MPVVERDERDPGVDNGSRHVRWSRVGNAVIAMRQDVEHNDAKGQNREHESRRACPRRDPSGLEPRWGPEARFEPSSETTVRWAALQIPEDHEAAP